MNHSMRLHPIPFEKMKTGHKTSELRIKDEKRSLIQVGDTIEFTSRVNPDETLLTKVTYLKSYPTFRDLFYGVRADYPDWEEDIFVAGMYEYYSREEEQKYGALEIGIEVISPK